ncbi:MAG: hypothetical protein BWY93_02221 [Euryarchaeota archaeon ADurb.BinA087]|nr:MAG: hypothetical protein BWY93_02221 [Euryarchaeota archaeon ADurb.BinA087]
MKDVCTLQELEDNGCRDNRTNTQLDQGTTRTGEQSPVIFEEIHGIWIKSPEGDIGHNEIQDEYASGP